LIWRQTRQHPHPDPHMQGAAQYPVPEAGGPDDVRQRRAEADPGFNRREAEQFHTPADAAIILHQLAARPSYIVAMNATDMEYPP